MAEETRAGHEGRADSLPPPSEPQAQEEWVKALFEQARQDVKRIVKKEREGEKINRELLSFRLRRADGP